MQQELFSIEEVKTEVKNEVKIEVQKEEAVKPRKKSVTRKKSSI